MVLEAIEDHRRGWQEGRIGLGGERVARGKYAIEHVMPRKWEIHWPFPEGTQSEGERDAIIHTIGNLTLLTSRLNSKVSNGPWLGENGKRSILETHDVLFLNRELLRAAGESWTDSAIRRRSDELSRTIIEIWPAPEGHRSGFAKERVRSRHKVDLSDLISAGCLLPGMQLVPRIRNLEDTQGKLLLDGRIEIGGSIYSSPSEAAKVVAGGIRNGWSFFLVDKAARRSLNDVRLDYLESIAVDVDDEDTDDEPDDDL
jgi:hypothetical protein